jgi:hypothetical protein
MHNCTGILALGRQMIKMKKICFLVSIITISSLQPLYAQPETVFDAYLQALVAEDWEKAETYWLPEEIRTSKRLGIAYTGTKVKYDCASPVISALEGIRSEDVKVSVTEIIHHDDWAQMSVQLTTPGDSAKVSYYLMKSEGDWRLVSPLFIHTRNWRKHDTRYFTVRFSDASLINKHALEELDRFVVSVGKYLVLSPLEMQRLEEEKIDYYLCGEEETKKLTGFSTPGMTNLQSDAIVSRHLPHYHEMVHLLMNYALKELPLYTLPCFQEGIAVCLGGRWGKSPGVIFQIGHFTLAQEIFQLEDVLSYDGFHRKVNNPDFSYPLSGIFVKFLIERFGMERFRPLYRGLSGAEATVRAFSVEDVQSKVSKICEMSWVDIGNEFAGYWEQFEFSGLVPGGYLVPNEPMMIVKSAGLYAQVWDLDDAYLFGIRAMTDTPSGVILMKDSSWSVAESYRSRLFAEHLPDAPYDGEVYGIQFSADDVGLYDYYTNNLVAKYVSSFSPSSDYWEPEERTIRFRLEKSVLRREISDFQLRLEEP